MAVEIEVWKEYEIADIARAVEESQGKPFRVWGSFHTCYFDLDYDPEYNLMFAYMMKTLDNYGEHPPLGDLIRQLMAYMNQHEMTFVYSDVCQDSEPRMKPFRGMMYKMFPNVKKYQDWDI